MRKKNRCRKYVISFLLPMLLFLIIMALIHVYPFGNNTVVMGDMKHQYITLMTYFKENFSHPRNFLYSYQIGLGGGFFAVLAYYLINPLNLLVLFLPASAMPTFFLINMTVNLGLIGLTTYTFLKKSVYLNRKSIKYSSIFALVLSTCFALSAFFAEYQECVMWVDAIVLFPLILLGLDRILYGDGSSWLYWITLGGMLLINWYMGIIVVIFLFISMLVWTIQQLFGKRIKLTLNKGLKILILSLLSIGVGTVMLLPSYLAQKNVDQAHLEVSFKPIYHWHSFFNAMFNGNDGSQAPLIFCGIVTIFLGMLYFFDHQYRFKERLGSLVYFGFLVLTTNLTFFYMMWHAFSMPNGFVQRESFVITFVLICFAYQGANALSTKSNLKLGFLIATLIAGSLLIANHRYHDFDLMRLSFELLILGIAMILFCWTVLSQKKFGYILLGITCVFDITYFNYQVDRGIYNQVPNDKYRYVVTSFNDAIKKIKNDDREFYRIGSSAEITPNDPLLFNYNGVQAYLSQQPTSMTDYISALGYYQKHSWIRWNTFNNGSTAAINDLLGIKYYLQADNSLLKATQALQSMPTMNQQLNTPGLKDVQNLKHIKIYERSTAFPLVFKATDKVLNISAVYNAEGDPFALYNDLLNSLTPDKRQYYSNLVIGTPQINGNDIIYNIRASQTGNYYLYLDYPQPFPIELNKPNTSLSITVNGYNLGIYGGGNAWGENGILYLGNLKDGEPIKITLKDGKLLKQPYKLLVSSENTQNLTQLRQQVVDKNIKQIHVNGNRITFETTTDYQGGRLVLSIPYNQGWKAKINGKKIPIDKALGDLSSIEVPKGKHQIELNYVTAGLRAGIVISLISLLGLIVFELVNKKYRK